MTNSDGHQTPARGVHGGLDGSAARCFLRDADGAIAEVPGFHRITLRDGQSILSVSCGGGGYGRPEERDPERVAKDVAEQWIDAQRALDVYRVAVRSDGAVDAQATAALRAS